MRTFTIGSTTITDDSDAYVIAEIGHNHGGSLDKAEELFRRAAEAGATAAKLQKRDNRSLFTKHMYDQPYTGSNSYGPTYGLHREALEFGEAEYRHLAGIAREVGIDFFSTAFDHASVDFLVDLDMPAIKLASADITNTPLLAYAAKTGRPLIMSTGGASMDDVQRACDTVLPINPNVALLQCTAIYPATPQDLNLSVIETFRTVYPELAVGYSGHDEGPELSWLAYGLGARVIEKHFTLDRASRGTDHRFSLDPQQLKELTAGLRRTRTAMGSRRKAVSALESAAVLKMGKKLVAARDLHPGDVVRPEDIAVKSPGDGLKPYQLDDVVGSVVLQELRLDDDFSFDKLQRADQP
ncbi:N-acetylneuraminate synthase family protein [Kitasatospora cineracea]|uniref:N-acetylneuraminate synthase family protein n=1 Tax=Kitasatospora cineracea TaxID=88074 RepID=UPI00367F45C0